MVMLLERSHRGAVSAALASAEETLAAEGVQTRSAFHFSGSGGLSWLAHASVLSGAGSIVKLALRH